MSGQSEPMASSIAANYCAKAAFGVLVKPLSWKPGRGLRLNTFRGSWAKDVINYPDTFSPQRESGYVQVTAESYSIHCPGTEKDKSSSRRNAICIPRDAQI